MRVIAVDNEKGALTLLADVIERVIPEAQTELFDNPSKAVAFAESNVIDIAFLDIHMFGISGLELAKKIKQFHPKTNIIFVTGFDEFAKDAVRLHASGYVTKPVTAEKIRAEMENLLHPIDYSSERFFCPDFRQIRFFRGREAAVIQERKVERGACASDRQRGCVPHDQADRLLHIRGAGL